MKKVSEVLTESDTHQLDTIIHRCEAVKVDLANLKKSLAAAGASADLQGYIPVIIDDLAQETLRSLAKQLKAKTTTIGEISLVVARLDWLFQADFRTISRQLTKYAE